MAENQNPVFTDNATITGDGTEANPLASAGSDSPEIVAGVFLTDRTAPITVSGDGAFHTLVESSAISLPDTGTWRVLVMASFVLTPQTGNTQMLWKFTKASGGAIGQSGGEIFPSPDGTIFYSRQWMAFDHNSLANEDAINLQMSAQAGDCDVSGITLTVFLVPSTL